MQVIIREHLENLYSNKLKNLEAVNRCVWPPKLNLELTTKINHLNRSITSNEIETVIKSHPTKKSPGLEGVTAEFYHTFKEGLTLVCLKLFQRRKEQESH
jgi:hypothetical protein